MQSVCVYCGSSSGARPEYLEAARAMGAEIARRGMTMVYGGASIGLMGACAEAALAGGARVIGIIPRRLVEREIAHPALSEIVVVETMHQRKAEMSARADGFVALPGGFGTMDELFEALTWTQLRIHAKRAGLLDVLGYYEPLVAWIDRAARDGFVKPEHRAALLCERDPALLLDRLSCP